MERWLVYSLLCLVLWGFWGVALKEAEARLGEWYKVYFASNLAVVVAVAVVGAIYGRSLLSMSVTNAMTAFLAGALGTLGYVFLVLSLKAGGPASIVIPLTALYPALTAVAAVILLGESLSARQAVGIALAMLAIYLMST